MSQAELGAFVQTHLLKRRIDVVLSGGAAVAFYTIGKYVSRDLDLVNRYFTKRSAIRYAMEELGFRERGRHYESPDTKYLIEFPPGPLSLGDDLNVKVDEIPLETGILRVISPTDCVKDRLAWYYHTGDIQCLRQAVLVSREHKIDIKEIRRWSEAEGKLAELESIIRQISY
jgi:hypothetical protein